MYIPYLPVSRVVCGVSVNWSDTEN